MKNALTTTTVAREAFDQAKLTEEIVTTVAGAEGLSPLEMKPLANVIDPDAVATLVLEHEHEVAVDFQYYGNLVRVSNDGEITVDVFDE